MASNQTATERGLEQPRELPLKITRELCQGRTYIVTGTNVGLGLEAVRHLVGIGAARVIMTARNLEAGETAMKEIEESTGVRDVAEVWHLDMSSYASVIAFCDKITQSVERIDAVIQNAAVAAAPGQVAEGHLQSVTVNVISPLLLLMLLLPKLTSDAKKFNYMPRHSLVTSGTSFDMVEYWKVIAEDPIVKMDQDKEIGIKSYPASKLLVTLATFHLGKLLSIDRGVILNAICPGICETSLSRNAPAPFVEHLKQLWAQCGRTAECGSRTLLAGAVAGKESHGRLMSHTEVDTHTVPTWVNETAENQAWTAVAKELETIAPGCVVKALSS